MITYMLNGVSRPFLLVRKKPNVGGGNPTFLYIYWSVEVMIIKPLEMQENE